MVVFHLIQPYIFWMGERGGERDSHIWRKGMADGLCFLGLDIPAKMVCCYTGGKDVVDRLFEHVASEAEVPGCISPIGLGLCVGEVGE